MEKSANLYLFGKVFYLEDRLVTSLNLTVTNIFQTCYKVHSVEKLAGQQRLQ
jgi:hypothetical protein